METWQLQAAKAHLSELACRLGRDPTRPCLQITQYQC